MLSKSACISCELTLALLFYYYLCNAGLCSAMHSVFHYIICFSYCCSLECFILLGVDNFVIFVSQYLHSNKKITYTSTHTCNSKFLILFYFFLFFLEISILTRFACSNIVSDNLS